MERKEYTVQVQMLFKTQKTVFFVNINKYMRVINLDFFLPVGFNGFYSDTRKMAFELSHKIVEYYILKRRWEFKKDFCGFYNEKMK